ncbi:MAG: hydroxymethylbilane synthase [Caldisphaeraceae archaeon]|nr:hydroxymethylbilane synthase [Caldisphaeraceae archaeon]
MKIRVATRGSKLSLKQTEAFKDYLESFIGQFEMEVKIIKTGGDLIQDKPLYEIGRKGLFEKEVNMAVLNGEADVAVHSMKDLPREMDPRLDIVMVLPREVPNDSIVFSRGEIEDIAEIPRGSVVGTSSVRRSSFILHYNDGVKIKPLRGNLDTRIEKLNNKEYDYIIVAEAGIRRLGLNPRRLVLPLDKFPPEPNQGVIAIVGIKDDPKIKQLYTFSDRNTYYTSFAEREFLMEAQAGCHSPIGAVAQVQGEKLLLIAGIASSDGREMHIFRFKGEKGEFAKIGRRAGELLYSISEKVLR